MKIGLLIPELKKGGAENVVSRLSIKFQEMNMDVSVIVFNSKHLACDFGGELISLESNFYRNPLLKLLEIYKRVKRLKKIKNEKKFDCVVSFLPNADIINILSKSNEKTFVSVRNHPSKSLKGMYGNIYKLATGQLYVHADKIIAVSKEIKNDLVLNFHLQENKVEVIYNAYPIDEIIALSNEKLDDNEEELFKGKTVVSVGRLTKQKGQFHLLRAFRNLANSSPDLKLILIGDGELKEALKLAIINLGLEQQVYMLGIKANPYKYMKNSSIFVLSSLYEGFPNALCESMICETPVISTNCNSGPYEIMVKSKLDIIEEKPNKTIVTRNGILVPPFISHEITNDDNENEEILANELRYLLNNESLYSEIKYNAFNRISEFHISKIIDQWINLFSE